MFTNATGTSDKVTSRAMTRFENKQNASKEHGETPTTTLGETKNTKNSQEKFQKTQ